MNDAPRLYSPAAPAREFSLMLGGPMFQLLRRAHLSDDALTMTRRRVLVIATICWVPLLVLTGLQRLWLDNGLTVPFLLDVDVHTRFLVALPLLVWSEHIVHSRLRHIVATFLDRKLIPQESAAGFDAAIESAMRWRNSLTAELLLLAVVYGAGTIWRHYMTLDASTWYATRPDDGSQLSSLSWAGGWFSFVSLPIFQFLMLRWYFRMVIWMRFLWQVSRLQLSLVPLHPDRVGGLGFLANTAYAFATLAAAHGAVMTGQIANRVLFLGAKLVDFKYEIAVVVVFLLALVIGPLLVFGAQLAQTKRTGLRRFGTLSERYARQFEAKWLDGGADPNEAFIGSADIQSLADLGNSYEIIKTMRFAPVTRDTIVQLTVATLAPMTPLLLTVMPLEQLVRTLGGAIF